MSKANLHLSPFAVDEKGVVAREIPAGVQAFAAKHGIQGYLDVAVKLVERHFTVDAPLGVSRIDDPESGSEWIEICARVLGDVPSVQAAHSKYTRDWLASVPLERSSLIRLAIDLG